MPTYAEQSALDSRCTWIWTTTNGVKGYIVRGKGDYASKSIFLPAAGFVRETSLTWGGTSGRYWSSIPVDGIGGARGITFSSGEHTAGSSANGRSDGFSVRPVRVFAATMPSIIEDPGATVTGDMESGYIVNPSVESGTIEVAIPNGVDAAKVTIEVAPTIEQVVSHGAKIRVVKDGHDITPYLDIPESEGTQFIASATVKEEIVREVLDEANGAVVVLTPSMPLLTTAPTRPGLIYTFSEGTMLNGMTQKAQKTGDGKAWTPEITVKGGASGFYSISVRKSY